MAAGSVAVSVLGPGLPPRVRAALAVAGTGAAAFGGYDDLAGSGAGADSAGTSGRWPAARSPRARSSSAGSARRAWCRPRCSAAAPLTLAINAGLVAGGANLLNLFDLRPGRALKVALAGGALLATRPAARPAVAAPLGAAIALLPEDLGERAMLGDAGANALGALLGTAAAASLSRPARLALLAMITGLTAASEVVSFTAVIERTPALRWLDMLGRRPVPAAAGPGARRPAARGTPGGRSNGGHSTVVTGPPASGTEASPLRQAGRGIGRAAALIGGITVIARVVGFGRQLVFAHTVGSHCLGTAYATANQVPNIIYDIVLGGALTGAIVPVLAGAAAHRAQYRPLGNGAQPNRQAGKVPAGKVQVANGGPGGAPAANGHLAAPAMDRTPETGRAEPGPAAADAAGTPAAGTGRPGRASRRREHHGRAGPRRRRPGIKPWAPVPAWAPTPRPLRPPRHC